MNLGDDIGITPFPPLVEPFGEEKELESERHHLQPSEDTKPGPGGFNFTTGVDKFVTYDDEGNQCTALLVNEWTIRALNKKSNLSFAHKAASSKVRSLQYEVERDEERLQYVEDSHGEARNLGETSVRASIKGDIEKRKASIEKKEELASLQRRRDEIMALLSDAADDVLMIFSGTMERAGLLKDHSDDTKGAGEEPSETAEPDIASEADADEPDAGETSYLTEAEQLNAESSSSYLGLEALHRETVKHAIPRLGERLLKAEEAFNQREDTYWDKKTDYQDAVAEGVTDWTSERFD